MCVGRIQGARHRRGWRYHAGNVVVIANRSSGDGGADVKYAVAVEVVAPGGAAISRRVEEPLSNLGVRQRW